MSHMVAKRCHLTKNIEYIQLDQISHLDTHREYLMSEKNKGKITDNNFLVHLHKPKSPIQKKASQTSPVVAT